MPRRRSWIAGLLAALLVCLPLASTAGAEAQPTDSAHPLEQRVVDLERRLAGLERLLALSQIDVPALVAEAAPAVVSLYQVTREDEVVSQGTGFLWSADGLVITNAHVVSDRELKVKAKFADGQVREAHRLLVDPFLDLAILDVDGESFPFLTFATAKPAVGAPVVVIGNAFGYSNSVTFGIVSGVDRPSPYHAIAHYPSLQTDAAINHGNSGGPILNAAGEVVAVATWTELKGESDSIAFGIPADQVAAALAKLDPNRGIVRPWLGIAVQEPYWARGGLPNELGLMVNDLHPHGAGARGGLARHDFIVAVNGVKVDYLQDLRRELEKIKPGESLTLTVERVAGKGYQSISLQVVAGERSDVVEPLIPTLYYDPTFDDIF